ncbi:hypothetical protein [Piscibacillus halophilus]|uniref:hypothetical protein n=1 Tax=Piscibacillus halophilus TaxID=571933 RepID=UPI00158DEFFC|nr:hypothetical protein [Piscibacillus halophilus]
MAVCTYCQHQWSRKEIWLAGWSKNGRVCVNCGERQYISSPTQRFLTAGYISWLFVLILPFAIYFYPNKIHLSNKNEGLFDY